MSYLEQVLKSATASQARRTRSKSNIQTLLNAVATPANAGNPTGKNPHSLGDGHGHNSAAEVKGLNAEFNSALGRLMAAAPGKVSIGSGYRSMAEQKILYDRYKSGDPRQKAPAAAPGKSNHNHGLAADLKYQDDATRRWVHANAAAYGLRFPMSYEPWHIEPIDAKSKRKS